MKGPRLKFSNHMNIVEAWDSDLNKIMKLLSATEWNIFCCIWQCYGEDGYKETAEIVIPKEITFKHKV